MSTENTEFILVLVFIIVLFSIQTTVNLVLPHPIHTHLHIYIIQIHPLKIPNVYIQRKDQHPCKGFSHYLRPITMVPIPLEQSQRLSVHQEELSMSSISREHQGDTASQHLCPFLLPLQPHTG